MVPLAGPEYVTSTWSIEVSGSVAVPVKTLPLPAIGPVGVPLIVADGLPPSTMIVKVVGSVIVAELSTLSLTIRRYS